MFTLPGEQPARRPARAPDPLWDAIVNAAGLDHRALTASTRSMVGRVRRELAEVGATPEQVAECARWLRTHRRWRDVRVHQLATEWPAFVAWVRAHTPTGRQVSDEQLERAMYRPDRPPRPADDEPWQLSRLVRWTTGWDHDGRPGAIGFIEHADGWVRDVAFEAGDLAPWDGLPEWRLRSVSRWRWNTVLDVARAVAERDSRCLVSAEHDQRMREAGITW